MPSDQDLISERDFTDVWGVYLKPSGDFFEFEEVRNQLKRPRFSESLRSRGLG